MNEEPNCPPDQDGGGRPGGASTWRRYVPSIALSAFLMSVTVAVLNVYDAMRGSDIVVLPPETIIVYRDGEGARAVMNFSVPLSMINAADSSRGDVLLNAAITPGRGAPSFRWQSTVNAVFADVSDAKSRCPIDRRCVILPGLVVIDEPTAIADLPGGQARARTYSFPIAQWNCSGSAQLCARFGEFGSALSAIDNGKPVDFALSLRFHGDGERKILCRIDGIDAKYLAQIGWASAACRKASVGGGPWL